MTSIRQWIGKSEPADRTGTATFKVGQRKYVIDLESFERYLQIGDMLDNARKEGKKEGFEAMRANVEYAMKEAERGQ